MPSNAENQSETFSPGNVVFGKYKVVRMIGDGGMGAVYEVVDQRLQKNLALKILNSQVRDAQLAIRFQNEARNASRVVHSAIAKIYDFGVTEDGRPYMTVELVNGRTLSNHVKEKGCLQIGEFLFVFSDLCGALKAAHSVGIVHRDLKPENIIVSEDEQGRLRAKLLDFGISRRVDVTEEEAQRLTKTGQVIGTPLYMSPEQANGQPVNHKSDYYSLGCVMFYSLAGHAPFRGDTAFDTLRMHCEDEIPVLDETADGTAVPDPLEQLIYSLMSKDIEERAESIDEIESVLRELATAREEELPPAEQPRIYRLPDKPSHKLFKIGLAVITVSLIGLVAVYWEVLFSNSHQSEEKLESNIIVKDHGTFSSESNISASRDAQRKYLKDQIEKHDGVVNLEEADQLDASDFAIVRNYSDIKVIRLNSSTEVTDDAVMMFKNNHDVNVISLAYTEIKSLDFVRFFPKLQDLDVSDTSIDDKDLAVFEGRPIFKLNICRTDVTSNGIEALKKYGFKMHSVIVSIKDEKEPQGITIQELERLVKNDNRIIVTSGIVNSLREKAFELKGQQKRLEADNIFAVMEELYLPNEYVNRANVAYQRAVLAEELHDDKKKSAYFDKAAQLYMIGVKRSGKEIQHFSKERLAEILVRQKRYEEAAAVEKEYVSRLSLDKPADAQLIYALELRLGNQYMGAFQYASAVRCFSVAADALQRTGKSSPIAEAEIAGNQAWCLEKTGKPDEALKLSLFTIETLMDCKNPSGTPEMEVRSQHQFVVNSYICAVNVLIAKGNLEYARRLNEDGLRYNSRVHRNPVNKIQMQRQRAQINRLSTSRGAQP